MGICNCRTCRGYPGKRVTEPLGVRVAGLLKLLYPALEVRDQFVTAVNLPDHSAYFDLSIVKLTLQLGFGSGHGQLYTGCFQ